MSKMKKSQEVILLEEAYKKARAATGGEIRQVKTSGKHIANITLAMLARNYRLEQIALSELRKQQDLERLHQLQEVDSDIIPWCSHCGK